MKLCRVFLVLFLALSISASASTIPPNLEARAAELKTPASPPVMAWVHDQAEALAKAQGPVDLSLLERSVRSGFGKKNPLAGPPAAGPGVPTYPNLGSMGEMDIMAMCFIVMMEAAKSAQEDLKAIMEGVKAINKEKEEQRKRLNEMQKTAAASRSTPTPGLDRIAQLVAKAQSIVGRTQGADLSKIARRGF